MTPPLSPKPTQAHETRHTDEPTTTGSDTHHPSAPAPPGPLASFVRFVVCGGGVGLASSAAVPLLATLMPWAAANALVTVASTILCTELHALFTFGAGRRPGRRQHLQSASSATAAYVATSAAVLALHAVQPSPDLLWEQTVYLTASGLAGIGRFLVLRLLVFTADRKTETATLVKFPAQDRETEGSAGSATALHCCAAA
ncbi:GtrA family protein [Streptomyces sp. NPDC002845]